MTRLFIALWPSPAAVVAAQADLAAVRARHPDLRWQPAERWHVTVAFLGAAEVDRTNRRLDRLLADPLELAPVRLAGAGAFGPVLWLGVDHGEWLTTLARRIQRELRTPDQRFQAHLTVGRGRGPEARRAVAAVVPELTGHHGPVWPPSEITLVESLTGPAPRYTVLRRWPFASA